LATWNIVIKVCIILTLSPDGITALGELSETDINLRGTGIFDWCGHTFHEDGSEILPGGGDVDPIDLLTVFGNVPLIVVLVVGGIPITSVSRSKKNIKSLSIFCVLG